MKQAEVDLEMIWIFGIAVGQAHCEAMLTLALLPSATFKSCNRLLDSEANLCFAALSETVDPVNFRGGAYQGNAATKWKRAHIRHVFIKRDHLSLNRYDNHIGSETAIRRDTEDRMEGWCIGLELGRQRRVGIKTQSLRVVLGILTQHTAIDVLFLLSQPVWVTEY